MELENHTRKLIQQDFSLVANLLPASSVSISFSVLNALKKLKSVLGTTVIKNFRKNEKAIITKIDQKLLEHSTIR